MSASQQELLDCEDYDTIAKAVSETARGRWFMAEHARRCQSEATAGIRDEIEALRAEVTARRGEDRDRVLRASLAEIARAIASTHTEIGEIQPTACCPGRLFEASGELDAIVKATEQATTAILGAAEIIQQHAWTMRERGHPEGECDSLDASATEIFAACGFQDITAQRTRKVIETLLFVENRIKLLLSACEEAPKHDCRSCPANTAEGASFWPHDPEQQSAVDATFAVEAPPPPNGGLTPPATFADMDILSLYDRLRLFR